MSVAEQVFRFVPRHACFLFRLVSSIPQRHFLLTQIVLRQRVCGEQKNLRGQHHHPDDELPIVKFWVEKQRFCVRRNSAVESPQSREAQLNLPQANVP